MKLRETSGSDWRPGRRRWLIGLALVALIAVAIAAWLFRDYARSPQALYREAQTARPERATALYARLAEELPQIEEYAQVWAAEAVMPDLEAVRTLQAVVAYRPQSPAAYQAHVALARHLAAGNVGVGEVLPALAELLGPSGRALSFAELLEALRGSDLPAVKTLRADLLKRQIRNACAVHDLRVAGTAFDRRAFPDLAHLPLPPLGWREEEDLGGFVP